jgi:hypothetical protein
MAKIDFAYEITEEQVRRFRQIPLIDRLRWVEELCVFTKMARRTPTTAESVAAVKPPRSSHHK